MAGVTTNLLINIIYKPNGPVTKMTYGDGFRQLLTYDNSYRLTGITDGTTTILRDVDMGYTARDNLASVTDQLDALRNESFTYSTRELVASANGAYGGLGFTYDAVGNRLTRAETVAGTTTTDTYSYLATDNRLASIAGSTARTFTHDAAGNVTYDNRSGAGYGYTYDAANRMESFSINGVVQAEYKYNYLGQQAIRTLTQTGQVIKSIYGPDGNRIAEFDFDPLTGSRTLIREYVWFDGKAIAVIEGGVIYFVRSDHIRRPVFATDATGTKVWEATYLPFGGVHTSTGANITLRFPGQWFQSESGLHQNWMRDYDPTTGRYIQADPLGLVDGASVYGYARQNPGRYVDPRGERSIISGTPWGRAGGYGRGLGELINTLSPGIGQAAASAIASVLPMGITDSEVGNGSVSDAIDRVSAAEANGQCPDPCDSARKRLADAKKEAERLGGCKKPGLTHADYLERARAFRELLFARSERDNICHAGPDVGHGLAQIQAFRAMKRCMSKFTK